MTFLEWLEGYDRPQTQSRLGLFETKLKESDMSSMRKLGVLVAVFALCAIGAANASAAEFTATTEGALTVEANANQVFKIHGGADEVVCTTVGVTGKAVKSGPAQHATVHYSGCTGPFGSPVDISPATYNFTAGGSVHIVEAITLKVTTFLGTCHITVPAQSVGSVAYSNNAGKVKITPNVSKITYHSSGFPCGASGADGTYTGFTEIGVTGGTGSVDTP
ncbi:MAG TPA: hypothetical protein VFS54_01020 [Solirubrobacterales bacterium]|nr:hypothetical protein [Solirubrobacterales bacterium]